MIIVTGAAGFIGSCLIQRLNQDGFNFIIAVDDFSNPLKMKNLENKKIQEFVHRDVFFEWLDKNQAEVEFCFHIGARTDTAEFDQDIFNKLNLNYSKQIWKKCHLYQIPLIYASSAATYGNGEFGYDDNELLIPQLKPLNPYGESKNEFDKWALLQKDAPFFWAGLKFFNVFGPNEYHKSRMASVIFHSYNQIKATGRIKLFKSHRPEFKDGEQMRDFVYVKDLVEVCIYLMHSRRNSGIYNLGTGKARTFLDLAKSTFAALNLEPQIDFIDTPVDIRDKYQYFTQANMSKLRLIGYKKSFTSLEDSVQDYVSNYLVGDNYL
jgi:ADP-L-glycero-D-manno-heptose 6-epimerase